MGYPVLNPPPPTTAYEGMRELLGWVVCSSQTSVLWHDIDHRLDRNIRHPISARAHPESPCPPFFFSSSFSPFCATRALCQMQLLCAATTVLAQTLPLLILINGTVTSRWSLRAMIYRNASDYTTTWAPVSGRASFQGRHEMDIAINIYPPCLPWSSRRPSRCASPYPPAVAKHLHPGRHNLARAWEPLPTSTARLNRGESSNGGGSTSGGNRPQ